MTIYNKATEPEELSWYFIERLNDGDIDALLALYEQDAVMVINNGNVARDADSIREIFERLVYDIVVRNVVFSSQASPTLRRGDLALISRRFSVNYIRSGSQTTVRSGVTNEVAHLQPDGTWLYIITQILFDNPT